MNTYSEKFKDLVLYVLLNEHYKDEGIKKLNKILYFIDFYYYRDHERFVSEGIQYAKAHMGPVVDQYKDIFNQMCADGVLDCHEEGGVIHHRPKEKYNKSAFSSEELKHINDIVDRYGKLSSAELESISHEQQPWLLTENDGDIIDPDLALLVSAGDEEGSGEVEIHNQTLKKELVGLANAAEV